MRQLMECFQNKSMLQIDIFNDGSSGSLNDKVGGPEEMARQFVPRQGGFIEVWQHGQVTE